MTRSATWRRSAAAIALGLLASCGVATAADRPLRVGAVPWRHEDALAKLYGPTLRLLERELGLSATLLVAQDIGELSQRIADGAVDIAFFGPSSYVAAKAREPRLLYLATCMLPDDHFT